MSKTELALIELMKAKDHINNSCKSIECDVMDSTLYEAMLDLYSTISDLVTEVTKLI